MAETMRLEYSSVLTDLKEANPSFDLAKLRIAYAGKNKNRTYISKATFENAIDSMFGCPVVVNYSVEENTMGSHDIDFVETADGSIELINLTEPVGFVPPGAQWQWENITDNNVIHQYLTTEVVLWKRQAAYKKIKQDMAINQSMEITVNSGEMKDDYYEVTDFCFTAFCLLGEDHEPCFESASLFTFNYQTEEIQSQFTKMYEDFKLAFANDEKYQKKEGLCKNMDKLNELLEKYNLTLESLPFEVENLTDEELVEKFESLNQHDDNSKSSNYELTYRLVDRLRKFIASMEVVATDYDSEIARYWYIDCDIEKQEVYFEDAKDDWHLYGAAYVLNGDNFVIDIENKCKKKYAVVDFDEGEFFVFSRKNEIDSIVVPIIENFTAKYDELSGKYNALIKKEINKQKQELFDTFEEKIGDMPEFKALKQEAQNYSTEEIENNLFSLIGRKQFKFSTKPNRTPKAPAFPCKSEASEDPEPYGGLFDYMKK